ncbi:hypothetical protein EV652_105463 [Kribbella steppae]|uniref:Uncharacterized protein n=1 Tax=Kribbella steppae TaxID=2512223 RepID=A0A4R2HKH8_9ACTN|nr:hypothetical protein EV652_105463 [Kribbella steppae]
MWVGHQPDEMVCVYDDEFVTTSGAVILSDAGYDEELPAEIGEGAHRLRVLVDELGVPKRVVYEFTDGATH